jgi:pSer/pThr/pTyr-binding forkhead associated (FHA) protein/archaellum component FlaC
MSPRSMSPPPTAEDSDLDSTAELPVLDPAALHAHEDDHSSTDTWAALPQLRHDHDLPPDATIEAVTVELRAAHQRLTSQAERLTQLENDREQLRAARLAAEQLVTTLSGELARLEALNAQHSTQSEELTQARAAAERRAESATAELTQLQSGGNADAARELVAQRAAAEQRASALDAELLRLRDVAVQHNSQFAELTGARAAAELRVGKLEEELQVVRAERDQAAQKGTQLQASLSEHEQALAAAQARQLDEERSRAERDRLHAAHAASIMGDLHAERARAMSCFESAQTLAAGRGIFEALVTDQHQEAQTREADLARVTRDLGAREARVREQDTELAERAQRLAVLEQQVTAFGAAIAERDTQLRDARRESQGLHASVARLQSQLEASAERVRALGAVSAQHTSSESQRKSELSRLLAERVDLTAAVEAARATASAAAASAIEHEAALTQRRARDAELEASLVAERKRAAELDAELTTVRGEMEDWANAVKSAHQERAALQTAQARVKELERRDFEHAAELLKVQAHSEGSPSRLRELEQDLVAAEEVVNRLESEARTRNARIEELEKAAQQLRATLEEAARMTPAGTDQPAAQGARREDEVERTVSPAPDGATRLLIRTDHGREVVYVLGRKTSVGRTPDNDLQIDAKFISRHHAVILAGPTQTIIEDLNSTNGVQVNGRRVTRQPLQDGDSVFIGRQQYRFAVRKSNDKR